MARTPMKDLTPAEAEAKRAARRKRRMERKRRAAERLGLEVNPETGLPDRKILKAAMAEERAHKDEIAQRTIAEQVALWEDEIEQVKRDYMPHAVAAYNE